MSDQFGDDLDPAEARATELLSLVGTWAPEVSASFSAALLARARTQAAIAPPLRVLGGFLLALAVAVKAGVDPTSGNRRA